MVINNKNSHKMKYFSINASQSAPWNFSDPSSDPCEDHWSGVARRSASSSASNSCYSSVAATNEVTQLDLSTRRLAGFIPEYFATNITSLEAMDLHDDDLTGATPSELHKFWSFGTDRGRNRKLCSKYSYLYIHLLFTY